MSRIEVYYNLHKHCWSIRERDTKIRHSDVVRVDDAKFVVQPGGRERVLREKRKNVHAFVRGTYFDITNCFVDISILASVLENGIGDYVEVTYNPYKYETFVVKATGDPVHEARNVIMFNKRVFARL